MFSGGFAPVSCAICGKRKEKRFCPAIHGRICPQCCGEQREVTLDCPSDCVYLQQAREHEKPRGMADVNPADVFLQVEIGDEFLYQREHLIMGLTFALAKSVRAERSLRDTDLIAAVTSLAKTYETLVNSGLHYETPIPNPAQQGVAAEVQNLLKEFREAEQKHMGYVQLRDSEVPARARLPGAHGTRPHVGKAEITSFRGVPTHSVSGEPGWDRRARESRQPNRDSVGRISDGRFPISDC